MPRWASFAASVGLGAALAAAAFGAAGGDQLDRSTTVEIALLIASGALIAVALARARPGRVGGVPVLAAFVVLTGLTAASILWSIQPDLSWVEGNRTLAYLATFAAGLAAAHLAPNSWTVVLRGVMLAALAVVAYGLTTRVFPGTLATSEIYARVGEPYGYWNALGATAAIAVPPTLWLGTRRSGHPPANALAYPVLGILLVGLFLSYSRGALGAAAIAVLLWLWIVPLRLRTVTLVAVASAGAAPVIVWALTQDAFTKNQIPLDVRQRVAPAFGIFLACTVIVLLAAGLAIAFRVTRRPPVARLRLGLGIAASSVALLVPLGLFTALAVSDRGLGGTVTASVEALTSPTSTTPGGPARLTSASSSRARYWTEAGHVFSHHVASGTGAGTFGISRLRYRTTDLVSQHAHGYVVQTMADLGLVGVAVIAVLALAWFAAAARALGLVPRRAERRFGAERVGLVALALTALVFGLHSTIDWIWFVPGPAVMAILAAGFVAGRSLRRSEPARPERTLARAPRYALASAAALVSLACAWAVWQPQRSNAETGHALDLIAANRLAAAQRAADDAKRFDPLSPDPLLVAASVFDARGNLRAAELQLERAVRRFPGDPEVWLRLADYQLNTLNRPAQAYRTVSAAIYLDPRSRAAQEIFFIARQRLAQRAPATPSRPNTGPKLPAPPGGSTG